MSAEEELKEHAEHARDPFDKMVAATMAILAAGLAIVSVLGHLATDRIVGTPSRALHGRRNRSPEAIIPCLTDETSQGTLRVTISGVYQQTDLIFEDVQPLSDGCAAVS